MGFLRSNILIRRYLSSSNSASSIDFLRVHKELVSIWEHETSKEFQNVECPKFSYKNTVQEYLSTAFTKWHFMDREMSSNVAGETGAVWIYKGALAATKYRKTCEEVESFANEHMKTEQQHLDYMQEVVPEHMHTKLLPLWKFCGFMLGFLPTIIGKAPALYHTVDAVESFVEIHYNDQIDWLKELAKEHPEVFLRVQTRSSGYDQKNISELIRLLSHCCEDEVEHKLDAKRRLLGIHGKENAIQEDKAEQSNPKYSIIPRIWRSIVDSGSRFAAELSRRV
jgi:ubiquinone biosynthesis monooxygenase Coq7